MAFKEIQPGQADWLNVLNESFKNNKWTYKNVGGTMINGCTGWVGGNLAYDEDNYIANICGWIKMPGGGVNEIATNPLDGLVKCDGLSVIGCAFIGEPSGQNNFTGIGLSNDGKRLGMNGASGDIWDHSKTYQGNISIVWIGPRSQVLV